VVVRKGWRGLARLIRVRPIQELALALVIVPVSLVVLGVRELRPRRRPTAIPVRGVVNFVDPSHARPRATVSYVAPDGSRVTGDSTEGFVAANPGDPITVWVDPANPRSFSLRDPRPDGAGLAFAAIGAGAAMVLLLIRWLFLV
jgi:hypothetical protein